MGKAVIVTGASGGIGGAIAMEFGRTGANVLVNYHSNKASADTVAARVRESGGKAQVYQADVSQFGEVKAMAKFAIEQWGRIDVLVNGAGGPAHKFGGHDQSIIDMDEAIWDKVISVNVKGAMLCIKAIAPHLIQQKDGHIINISSGVAFSGRSGRSPYVAAKAAVFGITKCAARELGEHNVKVNAVCPGRIRHSGWTGVATTPGASDNLLRRISGSEVEFAKFVVHLATMQDISGQILNLDSRILF